MSKVRRRDFLKTVGLGVLAGAGAKLHSGWKAALPKQTQKLRDAEL